MKKRVLLKDIAERSGLTVNTVSRALKNKSDIAPGTREYIQALALEMGYIPDIVAASLRQGYTNTIGVMFDNISNPYYMIMAEHLNNFLTKEGYDIMIFTSPGSNAQFDNEILTKMISRRLDGIITFLRPTEEVAHFAKANNLPLVVLGREADDIGIDSVYTNDFNGGELVGEHLIDRGCSKVGYFGVPEDIMCSRKRAEGLLESFKKVNINLNQDLIKFMEHGDASVGESIMELVNNGAEAIFCFNDMIAYEAIAKLRKEGIKVPDDILVVGYDNIEDHLKLPVGLTSVSSDKNELAVTAAKVLLKRIDNPDVPLKKIVKDTKLIVRKTA